MGLIFKSLNVGPEYGPPLMAGMVILVVGYFLSKILAAIIARILPKARPSRDGGDINLTWQRRVVRACFWFSWLIFILIAINQVYDLKIDLTFENIDYSQLSLMGLLAYMLIISEASFSKLRTEIMAFLRSMTLPKSNPAFVYLKRYFWIPLLIIFIIASGLPGTFAYKIAITVFVLFAGLIVSAAVKEILATVTGKDGDMQKVLLKFTFYFAFVYFLVVAIRLWR